MAEQTQIPVYLFTGFLEAGKTKFIQETLEDKRFNNGEPTLLLVCEEGIEEYEPETYPLSEEPHLKSDVDFSLTGKFKVYLDYEGVDSSYEVNVGNLGGSGVDEQEQKNLLAMTKFQFPKGL